MQVHIVENDIQHILKPVYALVSVVLHVIVDGWTSSGNSAELEAELIKRNREIAKAISSVRRWDGDYPAYPAYHGVNGQQDLENLWFP